MCEFPGQYLFSTNIRSASGNPMWAEIEIGGRRVAAVWCAADNDSASNTVIVFCPQNAQVYVSATWDRHTMEGDPSSPVSTFTGILLSVSE